ncbi:LPS export ABC transporter periplasmic protein LptC [candidate division KSB1 bacterium]|nr:LPS export ABC transporter periplasmic protein LptC [candidate division KSB1 bacterium]
MISGCQNSSKQAAEGDAKTEFPDQEGWNSTLTVTNAGKKSAIIQYGHMARFSRLKKVHFDEGVKVDFFRTDGKPHANLVADSALLNEDNNNMEAIGNVVVIKGDTTLRTTSLKWIDTERLITSDVPFTMLTQQGDSLFGQGFEMEQNTSNMRIYRASGVSHQKLNLAATTRTKPAALADSLNDSTKTEP